MMLGLQYLSMYDARAMTGDYSRLSLEELEDVVGKYTYRISEATYHLP